MNKKICNTAGYHLWLLPCLAITLSACSNSKPMVTSAEGTGKIVAEVNAKPIFASQLVQQVTDKLRKHKNPPAELIEIARKAALDSVIKEELLYQASQTLLIPDIDEKIEEKFQDLKTRLGSEERFLAYLKRHNQTVETFRVSAKRNVFIGQYLAGKGLAEPHIPEEDIKSFYKNRPFNKAESIRVSQILLTVAKDAKPAEKEEIRRKAEEIRRRIIEGADFAELAKEHSDSKEPGGDLGYVRRNFMPPEFDKVMFSLKENDLSNVFETKLGYHIVKLVDKRSGQAPYEDLRGFFMKYLQQQRRPQMIAAHIEELRSKATIERK